VRGRKPKPTAVKVLEGNPGKRALNGHEPSPRRRLPRCPAYFGLVAKAEWKHVARDLYDAGVLTGIDHAALEGYCLAYERRVRAYRKIQAEGEVTPGGQQSAWLIVFNKADKQVHEWSVEFGMTASSRSRIHVDKPGKEASLAELLFSGVADDE